jgi:uncharacterized membrane protein
MHLLFWISLIPFTTAWLGEHPSDPLPVAVYGLVLLASAVAWYMLQATIIRSQGSSSPLKAALGKDWKGKIAPLLYLVSVGLAFVCTACAEVMYAAVALMWLVPDRRIETAIKQGALRS